VTPYQAQHKYRPGLLTYWAAITQESPAYVLGNPSPPGHWIARCARTLARGVNAAETRPPRSGGASGFRSCDAPWEASTALLQRFAVLGQVETFDLMLLAHP
jgi:hypothetical protein